MVNFDKLGSRAGETDRYSPVRKDWENLSDSYKRIVIGLVRHPEKTQKDIAEMAGVRPETVHYFLHALSPEKFTEYKQRILQESDISINLDDAATTDADGSDQDQSHENASVEGQPVDHDETITVTTTMPMQVAVSIPRSDLETATMAAMSRDLLVGPPNVGTSEGIPDLEE